MSQVGTDAEAYLSCPRRPGRPRVAEAVCRACKKGGRCPAWRDFICPPLFPGLYDQPSGGGRRRS